MLHFMVTLIETCFGRRRHQPHVIPRHLNISVGNRKDGDARRVAYPPGQIRSRT